jgi:hypothetical protein
MAAVPVIAGVVGCTLDGLTIISASGYGGMGYHVPAVRVWDGYVQGVTSFSSQLTGATDVLDGENRPVGSWVARSGGGFTIVGNADDAAVGNTQLTAHGGDTHSNGNATDVANFIGKNSSTVGHALLVGQTGERHARLAVETSGALRWGDGHAISFHTTLRRVRSNSTALDLPAIEPGGVTRAEIRLEGALSTDMVAASLSSLGEELIFVTARVSAPGVGQYPIVTPVRGVLKKIEPMDYRYLGSIFRDPLTGVTIRYYPR